MLSYFFTYTQRQLPLTAVERVLVATAIFNAFIAVLSNPQDLVTLSRAMIG